MHTLLAALLLIAAPAPLRLIAHGRHGTLTLLAARGAASWRVTVLPTGQRIVGHAEADALPAADPILMPLRAGGRDDLLLPVALGMVNFVWDVWLQQPGGRFAAAGRLGGVRVARDLSGAIVTLARDSCCAWVYSVYRIAAGPHLVHAFDIAAPLDPRGRITACGAPRGADPVLVARLCRVGAEPMLPGGRS